MTLVQWRYVLNGDLQCSGRCNTREKMIEIRPSDKDDDIILLHEMIHAHEFILSEASEALQTVRASVSLQEAIKESSRTHQCSDHRLSHGCQREAYTPLHAQVFRHRHSFGKTFGYYLFPYQKRSPYGHGGVYTHSLGGIGKRIVGKRTCVFRLGREPCEDRLLRFALEVRYNLRDDCRARLQEVLYALFHLQREHTESLLKVKITVRKRAENGYMIRQHGSNRNSYLPAPPAGSWCVPG